MKMLFFSANNHEVEEVSREFDVAGIRCEIRSGPTGRGMPPNPAPTELWIHDDRDCHRALMLCVQLGVGFAKRPPRKALFDADPDDLFTDRAEAAEPEMAIEETPLRNPVLRRNGRH